MSGKKDFFRKKQAWSQIKDNLLSAYLTPYLAKMAYRKNATLIADCFAGKGRFDDGEPGSPVLICDAVETQRKRERVSSAETRVVCIEKRYHKELVNNLTSYSFVNCFSGTYEERMDYLLKEYAPQGQDLLLYVDPYGIKSIRFSHFEAITKKGFSSVELLLNLNTFGFLREGCRLLKNADIRKDDLSEDAPEYVRDIVNTQVLDEIVGGEYWRELIEKYYAGSITFREAEERFSTGFCARLKNVFSYSLSMPIKTKLSNIPKYRIVYGTNHPHGLILMADNMSKRWTEFKESDRKGQMVLFDLDYPESLVDASRAAVENTVMKCVRSRVELSSVLAGLIDQFGIVYSVADYNRVLKSMDGQQIHIEREPTRKETAGKKLTGMDYKSKHYRVYISRRPQCQQNLL